MRDAILHLGSYTLTTFFNIPMGTLSYDLSDQDYMAMPHSTV